MNVPIWYIGLIFQVLIIIPKKRRCFEGTATVNDHWYGCSHHTMWLYHCHSWLNKVNMSFNEQPYGGALLYRAAIPTWRRNFEKSKRHQEILGVLTSGHTAGRHRTTPPYRWVNKGTRFVASIRRFNEDRYGGMPPYHSAIPALKKRREAEQLWVLYFLFVYLPSKLPSL
jgi:hypothetical protein